MSRLTLIDNKNMVLKTGTTEVIKELVDIIDYMGSVPKVSFDGFNEWTKLEFEGKYGGLNLYIKGGNY